MKTPRLQLIFAHIDEAVPPEFFNYAKPIHLAENQLTPRQIQKWKSRRLAHYLLHLLCQKNHIDTACLTHIPKTASGRPYLCLTDVDFNISHSGNWVAVLFSVSDPKVAVGVDIEQPQKMRPYRKLWDFYADPAEIAELEQGEHLPQLPELADRFYLSWCLREAVLKAQGAGLVKLSSVRHSVKKRQISTAYAPTGKLFFYPDLPFYLACFIAQQKPLLLTPELFQWQANQLLPVETTKPIIYQVN